MDTEPDADDLWHAFYRPKSLRSINPPIFVPASASHSTHDDDAHNNDQGGNHDGDDVATWYGSLSRRAQHNPPAPAASLEAPPEPSSSACPPIQPTPTLRRGGHDWFISRAISQQQAAASTSASAPATPRPTLADLLSRNPPTAAQPFRPPAFLHLGPSNKGWVMLENQGWSEGEGLGSSAPRSSDSDARSTKRLPIKKGKAAGRGSPPTPALPSPPLRERTSEVFLDHDIVELRRVPVIDLTLSDTEREDVDVDGYHEDEEEGDDDDEDDDRNNDNDIPFPSPSPKSPPSDPRAEPTVLLTPLPTVLKSDRLGIGLKAKTEGPYRSSARRVTHNAAALAAHVKVGEDLRRTQHRFGKGRRAFAREEHLERERRQNMMAYLSEP